MSTVLGALIAEAQRTGRLADLPEGHWIDGTFVPSISGAMMETFDPGTGLAFAQFSAGSDEDVDRAVRSARAALTGPWGRLRPAERGRILMHVAALIRQNADRLAVVESLDSGKQLVEARGDVAGAAAPAGGTLIARSAPS